MNSLNIESRLAQLKYLIEQGIINFDFEMLLEHHYRKWLTPGDTVADVGSHVGRHLAQFVDCIGPEGKVVAFEPLPFAFDILKSKFSMPNVKLNNVALSDFVGDSDFTYARGTPEESGLKQRTFNMPHLADPTKIRVKVDTLDQYTDTLKSLSYVKIDIEGGEVNCLRGATRTLSMFRPLVSCEYGSMSFVAYGTTSDDLFDFAHEHNYEMFDIFLNHLVSIEDWRASLDQVYWDFFMVPKERLDEFKQRMHAPSRLPYPSALRRADELALQVHTEMELRRQAEQNRDEYLSELHSARTSIDQLRAENQAIRQSTSWKVTAPIRRLVSIAKR